MRSFADIMRQRLPEPDEIETRDHVMDIARAWEVGEIGLDSVRAQCNSKERLVAMRFVPNGSEDKQLIMELVDTLVAEDAGGFFSKHGWINFKDEVEGQARASTNAKGQRVWVWAMHYINGVAHYPAIEEGDPTVRQSINTQKLMTYNEYRRAKRKGRPERSAED